MYVININKYRSCFSHPLCFILVYTCIFAIRGLFDKFVENVYKIVSDHSILIVVAHDTVHYEYDRHCKFQLNMFTRKKVTHILPTYGNRKNGSA